MSGAHSMFKGRSTAESPESDSEGGPARPRPSSVRDRSRTDGTDFSPPPPVAVLCPAAVAVVPDASAPRRADRSGMEGTRAEEGG